VNVSGSFSPLLCDSLVNCCVVGLFVWFRFASSFLESKNYRLDQTGLITKLAHMLIVGKHRPKAMTTASHGLGLWLNRVGLLMPTVLVRHFLVCSTN
jgi:hypothetical protein